MLKHRKIYPKALKNLQIITNDQKNHASHSLTCSTMFHVVNRRKDESEMIICHSICVLKREKRTCKGIGAQIYRSCIFNLIILTLVIWALLSSAKSVQTFKWHWLSLDCHQFLCEHDVIKFNFSASHVKRKKRFSLSIVK